jgi:pimeloyl-ACP methyl ester carboxylesterase
MSTLSGGLLNLFHQEAGTGVPLVLLHGFPLDHRMWAPQLAAAPAGVRVIAPDLPGFGRSAPAHAFTMEAFAESVFRLLDSLAVPSAVVGGLSMGGYVAMAMTRLDPGRVRGLVLIDTQSAADDDAGRARREATAQELERDGVEPLVRAMMPRLLAPQADAALRAEVERLMRAQPVAAMAATSRGLGQRTDAKDILSRYANPCLVLVGEHDLITPLERARQLQGLVSGSTLEVIAGAGHLASLEQPAAVTAAIARFVATIA